MSGARLIGSPIVHGLFGEGGYAHTWTSCNLRVRLEDKPSEFDSTLAHVAVRTDEPIDCMTCLILATRAQNKSTVTNPCEEIELSEAASVELFAFGSDDPGEPGVLRTLLWDDPKPR